MHPRIELVKQIRARFVEIGREIETALPGRREDLMAEANRLRRQLEGLESQRES